MLVSEFEEVFVSSAKGLLSCHNSEKYSIWLKTCFIFYLKIVASATFHSKMDSIAIRKYKLDDYKDVCWIFVTAHQGSTKHVIPVGRKSPYVISYLTILAMIGLFYSILCGLIALIVGLSFHAFAVFIFYNYFAL